MDEKTYLAPLVKLIGRAKQRLNELQEYYQRYKFYAGTNHPNSKGVITSVKLIRSDFLKLLNSDYQLILDNNKRRQAGELLDRSIPVTNEDA
ncbi:hypothetical protein JI57_02450 [Psychromonas sp. PRT-SC03]|nr:hypothetical protein JI57_02450 [Psychromonas sp. PRT-SC03]